MELGEAVGVFVGDPDGASDTVGAFVGVPVGDEVGAFVGVPVGAEVGGIDGESVGESVGLRVVGAVVVRLLNSLSVCIGSPTVIVRIKNTQSMMINAKIPSFFVSLI